MAIPYLNISFSNVRTDGGACEDLSYIGRCVIPDTRLAMTFDYRHLRADLVHSETIRPIGVSDCFADLTFLASSMDAAALRKLKKPLGQSQRPPQNAMCGILALPPNPEITLAESVELTRRIALSIVEDRPLPIYAAIHDPSIRQPGARNRHAHFAVPNRPAVGDQIVGNVIRDLAAHPLSLGGGLVMIEGDRWPSFCSQQQQLYFAELAIDLVVDPIAVFSGRHRTPEEGNGNDAAEEFETRIRRLNQAAITGDATSLLTKLLRGRSMLRIAELERFVAKHIDSEDDRQEALETILANVTTATFAVDTAATTPRFITTVAAHDLIQQAVKLVDRAADTAGTRLIHVVSAAAHSTAVQDVVDMLTDVEINRRPMLVGNNSSECGALSTALEDRKPIVKTIKAALSELSTAVSGHRNNSAEARKRLLIVPRAESVDDQTLSRLIVHADQTHAFLMLLHDQSVENGIVSHRLTAYAAERLAFLPAAMEEDRQTVATRYLRSGLIYPATQLLRQHADIKFEAIDSTEHDDGFGFIVCDNPSRINDLNDEIRLSRINSGELGPPIRLGHPRKPVWVAPGEKIVFTRDDLSIRPPRIRAGEIAEVVAIDKGRYAIDVTLPNGKAETINLKRFSHFRSAYAVPVRIARMADHKYSLRIEVSDPHHVWAYLLLAALRQNVQLLVDPRIATDIPSLIAAARSSLPAALPRDLTTLRDPSAEIRYILDLDEATLAELNLTNSADSTDDFAYEDIDVAIPNGTEPAGPSDIEIELFPEPEDVAEIRLPVMATSMHEDVRAVMMADSQTKRGLKRLQDQLSRGNPQRDANAMRLKGSLGEYSLFAEIVSLLHKPAHDQGEDDQDNHDLPLELERLSPREWGIWDLYLLRTELAWHQFDFKNWGHKRSHLHSKMKEHSIG